MPKCRGRQTKWVFPNSVHKIQCILSACIPTKSIPSDLCLVEQQWNVICNNGLPYKACMEKYSNDCTNRERMELSIPICHMPTHLSCHLGQHKRNTFLLLRSVALASIKVSKAAAAEVGSSLPGIHLRTKADRRCLTRSQGFLKSFSTNNLHSLFNWIFTSRFV